MLTLFFRVGRAAGFGITEQALSSISNFLYIVFLSRLLDGVAFGWFSIAWSGAMLIEAIIWGMIGDGVPAIAVRVPMENWPQLRGAILALSVAVVGSVSALLLIAAALTTIFDPSVTPVLAGTAIAVPGLRGQQVYRRLCYLDERRDYALYGTVCFSLSLALLSGISWYFRLNSTFVALGALGLACGATLLPLSLGILTLRKPTARLLVWATRRMWRSGRWLMASSLSFWLGNTGMVPLAGALYGLEASGSLRVLQNMANPLTQLSAVMFSIALPPAARKLRNNPKANILRLSIAMLAVFSLVGFSYVVAFTALGTRFLNAVFPGKTAGISDWTVAVVMCSAAFDVVRSGASVPMFALGNTREFFMARSVSLVVLFVSLLALSSVGGLLGLCLSMALGNLAATIIIFISLTFMIRKMFRSS
ncbi:lipopolysaccharide biosynthesis protein [Sphingomonas sp. IC081]|uniref:lipopolysaccharide biosynthesis protein n=1 Tax=Sphingomonas sp. IC081 TaxID=304378 RepID=UPI00115AA3B2|nr:oligosaccharide flippase family protein [Sphingomonas sp. IC081]QDK36054.1 hypothetical protein DM450_25425 [Sphingomonas sp. IC081]